MLTSVAIILLLGYVSGWLFSKMKLPSLIGMILLGICIGPYALNVLDSSLLEISSSIRQVALVIILTRAGLSLNLEDLKRVGRPAILMCFVPACFEMLGIVLLGPLLFNISLVEALVIGTVVAAVSPAVIVPRMISLIDQGYGKEHSIPQLILAAASVDDIFVIVVFTVATSLALTNEVSMLRFVEIPVSIILGILLGIVTGMLVVKFYQKISMRKVVQVFVLLSISFLLLEVETLLKGLVPVSGLLAIMATGMYIKQKDNAMAISLAKPYSQLWSVGEVFLFVLVGACVNIQYAMHAGILVILLVCLSLVFRMVGVWVSLMKSPLTAKERLFCMIAYTPKATVQASIGAIPLSMGLACGELVLTVAVLSILLTAPFGALGIDALHKRLLKTL
ncbi:MAG: cation:proton antiporter [Erysipelotrichaceae bacterium]|nr:cation:proton antiporter [Erysipelotrichaceae bacterium]